MTIITRTGPVTIPPPSAYGLPAHFSTWRPNQAEAAVRAIDSPRRFPTIVAPTGFGKSAVAETIARYVGRSAYLTITKALQDQISREIEDRYDIRGKSNYDCQILNENGIFGWQGKVDQADVLCDSCAHRDRSCEYYARHRRVRLEKHISTNYSKWLTGDEETFGEFDVLVADEAHGAPDQISSSVRVEIKARWIDEFLRTSPPDLRQWSIDEWIGWSRKALVKIQPRLDSLVSSANIGNRSRMRELREVRAFHRALTKLSHDAGDGWIEERTVEKGDEKIGLEPVWPRAFGERLFRGIGKVVFLSATIRPKTLELMGIDPADVDFAEYPSSFPVDRRPVYWIKTVAMRFGMSEEEIGEAVRRVDQIIDGRTDRNGLIHTNSFEWARQIMRLSQHSNRMYFNEPRDQSTRNTAEVVERFRQSLPGAILIGPSFDTGWDFPMTQVEYQIIFKVPLLNRKGSPIADARCKEDSEYDGYQAMQKIVQMSGRPMRSAEDRCETFITDDAWGNWFLRANRKHAPQWFLDGYRGQSMIPPPAQKL